MIDLKTISTEPPSGISKKEINKGLVQYRNELFELQNKFYADSRFGLLIILQGMDTSGKDGTIRHALSGMNPQGVRVKSFKKPTEEELKHDFLWRVYPDIPEKGMIQVFNRSYYEDILVPRVLNSVSEEILAHRCKLLKYLEQHLRQNNIHVLKFFLHISKEQQQERINERLIKPHKRWKYSAEDEKAANQWGAYQNAYNMAINNCDDPPWHIVPADKRWYRNYSVAKIVTEHLKKHKLTYPNT
ncbi:PPK2 family polyphosphate kinase [Maribacter sp. 4G9]|jgi:PPK2 family polyphosphate:nucleotide phosphotransferase|uniref:PPK2 family polyphosphate kinase n=1 Tax=Maribacter sp. 4G9 TaxID=1889777 RepID=UPI000C1602FC|nr:PPK2 family polyphosphate kinase [Maribacter sp. 4G9]PIB38631.1 polyphosphate kinase [Maribacter sp. 4G9]|tara:strand:+ start:198 stop:929 length:732 start_codon:yes stop_codon:yes gene_type:complete